MKVLLTNDDGIGAQGLQTLRRALLEVPGIELATIAPNSNRSATARSITTREPLWVDEIEFEDGTIGYGINHGSNLGDDITYSGTVAAALEGVILGVPGIAVSQQSAAREMDFRLGQDFDFEHAARF